MATARREENQTRGRPGTKSRPARARSAGFRSRGRTWLWRIALLAVLAALAGAVVLFVIPELKTSAYQARHLAAISRRLTFRVEPGPSPSLLFAPRGPYDLRLGYASLPTFLERLTSRGNMIAAQARLSPRLRALADLGVFPIYHEKTQAGLDVLDKDGTVIFSARYPERVYRSFESIPPLVVETLLFIENRDLLDPRYPNRNPAVEWDRFAKAAVDRLIQVIDKEHEGEGGSTLATQLEKYRHSPEGRTTSVMEKLRQMTSASFRAYLDGEETLEVRKRIVLDYINSVPLAAFPGYGEVNGLGDGLWVWYGADLDEVNRLLDERVTRPGPESLEARARAFTQVLSLFLAHRRPTYYLLENQNALRARVRAYLNLLFTAGIISAELRDEAMAVELSFKRVPPATPEAPFSQRKESTMVRTAIMTLLGVPQLYDLDRLDLTVKTTLDHPMQMEMTEALEGLRDQAKAAAAGIIGFRLLEPEHVSKVTYSITLYERVEGANVLRVQADNLDQPLNINEGVKLELGSTAKLRTLITYLEVVSALHDRYAGLSPEELRRVDPPASDRLTRWALEYLSSAPDKGLPAMLEAAMERRYSASPSESFFTGGGLHTFANYEKEDDERVLSVRQAFHRSVNLVFIRLMRDIVHYYMFQIPGSTARMLQDAKDPQRKVFLERFADREGRQFLVRFYNKYRGKSPEEALDLLLGERPSTKRLAVVFRTVEPEADFESFVSFMNSRAAGQRLDRDALRRLYTTYDPSAFNLADRGYLAGVHPLELWVVAYLRDHPGAERSEVIEASSRERQEVYTWLFKTHHKNAQDVRLRTMMEVEAFQEIHQSWRRLGYPFGALVPSYATAIGSSADRPAALAELVGIVMNNGVKYPMVRIEEMHFAANTPYETIVRPRLEEKGEQVLAPEIAKVVRDALVGVVEQGTAVRVRNAFKTADGKPIVVGGKTGTGDNRFEVYAPGGRLISSRVVNRTAAFVFMIGDRFFGAITAYVEGPVAGKCGFTSSLPVQILKTLAPTLRPLLER